uniref:Putative secreted protein n=1 Tax=Anopheles darlingi TaxID=43151 RepID=A0A2M4D0H6_ANODA
MPDAPPTGKCFAATIASSLVFSFSQASSKRRRYCSALPPATFAWQNLLSKDTCRFKSSEMRLEIRSNVVTSPEFASLLRKYLNVRGIGNRFCSRMLITFFVASPSRSRLMSASMMADCSVRFSFSFGLTAS